MNCIACQLNIDDDSQDCPACGFPVVSDTEGDISPKQLTFARRQWQLLQSSNNNHSALPANKGQKAFESLMAHYIKPIHFNFLKNVFKKFPSVEQLKGKMLKFELIKEQTSFENPYLKMLKTMPVLRVKQFLVKDNIGFKFNNIKSFKQTNIEELFESQTSLLKEALAEKREEIKAEALKKYQKLEEHRQIRNKNGNNKL